MLQHNITRRYLWPFALQSDPFAALFRMKMQSSINIETVYVTPHCMEPLQNTLQLMEGMRNKSWIEIVPALGFI